MIATFFPVKKLRRKGKFLLFVAILLVGAVAVYHEMVAAKAWGGSAGMNPDTDGSNWGRAMQDRRVKGDQVPDNKDLDAWKSSFIPQAWKPEYRGMANLHVFEDWCGSSTAVLRKNLHYPLYPHSRTTVQKLAVTPQWTNYGLRIFGYIHPFADGDFVFALSSDDNSEFWLSTDESPLNLELLAWVGKTGAEWTAPGEFEKYASQTSAPTRLSARKRYFFEVIHKQNDKGTDHVEVAWQLLTQGFRLMVIDSRYISLYVNESALLISEVSHVPQTAASHQPTSARKPSATADMLREDPRDSLYQVPLTNSKFLQGVLPDCSYEPTYTIKNFPLLRYQGLQFVHMSYIYPNDFTRLTHMERENSCFYPKSTYYMKMSDFSRYMRLDQPGEPGNRNAASDFDFRKRKSVVKEDYEFGNDIYPRDSESELDQHLGNNRFSDYGDDYDDYVSRRRRKLFSLAIPDTPNTLKNFSGTGLRKEIMQRRENEKDSGRSRSSAPPQTTQATPAPQNVPHQQNNQREIKLGIPDVKRQHLNPKGRLKITKRPRRKSPEITVRPVSAAGKKHVAKIGPLAPSEQLSSKPRAIQRSRKTANTQSQKFKQLHSLDRDALISKPTVARQQRFVGDVREFPQVPTKYSTTPKRRNNQHLERLNKRKADDRKSLREKEIEMNVPLQQDVENRIQKAERTVKEKQINKWMDMYEDTNRMEEEEDDRRQERTSDKDSIWDPGKEFEVVDDEDATPAPVFDAEVNWGQTFQVNHLDLQSLRSDWIDLSCNISGNLLLHISDTMPIVEAFMEKLNEKHQGWFQLMNVVNVEKRVDGIKGSRYLLELELKDVNGQKVRLSHYIYALIRHRKPRRSDFDFQRKEAQMLLCNPVGFRWNPLATVHFIVPVKNQARWVQKLIDDMEDLFRATGDTNFNLIITDYNSTDMDVKKALERSSLPRHQYVKLSGNFERSAGLQAGINLINDEHSIVFLCDLHIHFPPSIIDTIRKHCVEGFMAFAPIVMRLDCGSTPLDARGYWEVNGFGLLGIYKSDLDAVGGMNTKEFTNRWGGEDWELLDRILQAGLEVDRIYLRNFFHHFHSKRGMWNRRMSQGQR